MNNVINKITSTIAGGALFVIGCVIAGLGFSVLAVLAVFALAMLGLAFLAAPFLNVKLSEAGAETEAPLNQETATA